MIDFAGQSVIVTGAGRGLANLDKVSATEPFAVPGSIFEEVFGVCDRLGVKVF